MYEFLPSLLLSVKVPSMTAEYIVRTIERRQAVNKAKEQIAHIQATCDHACIKDNTCQICDKEYLCASPVSAASQCVDRSFGD